MTFTLPESLRRIVEDAPHLSSCFLLKTHRAAPRRCDCWLSRFRAEAEAARAMGNRRICKAA
jgi:hypothetical protein